MPKYLLMTSKELAKTEIAEIVDALQKRKITAGMKPLKEDSGDSNA